MDKEIALEFAQLKIEAQKVIDLVDLMLSTFESMEEDEAWRLVIAAALFDTKRRRK